MPVWLTWIVAMGLLIGESALLAAIGAEDWVLQMAIVVTVFLALRREFVGGALVLAGLLAPIEWLVVGPSGFYALGLVAVFVVFQLARGHIESEWGLSQALLAVVAVGLHTAVMVLAILFLEPDARIVRALLWSAPAGALGAALTVWPVGAFLARLDAMVDSRSSRGVHLS